MRIDGVIERDAATMAQTYSHLSKLYRCGKNGIWPFILRNLMRPLWLSRPDQRADVLIGNPPWIAYRHLSPEMKVRLRDASRAMNLWVGGVLATQQDMSALFWARGAERYLRQGGVVALVLPYAALNRPAFGGMRSGNFRVVQTRITEAWDLARVRPIFGEAGTTSSSVIFGRRDTARPLPTHVCCFEGRLPRRDATEVEADRVLTRSQIHWPPIPTLAGASTYRSRFQQGATITPRRFYFVEREAASRLGENPAAPRVRGKIGSQDKAPWKDVEPPHGAVEAEFLRPVVLGESVGPFRLLDPALAVLPIDAQDVVDAESASNRGYRHLASWLRYCEQYWVERSSRRVDGSPRMTLKQRLDRMRLFSSQLNVTGTRVVYNKEGTILSATIVDDPRLIIDHLAYWAVPRDIGEARYLIAILNSRTVLDRVIPMQPRGADAPRHFDNLPWELPVPAYDARERLHCELAVAAEYAEQIATALRLPNGHAIAQRRAIRDALAADGIAARIDALVARLLDGP